MPAQVCRRWRRLILGSASHLRLCLVCTQGTPVADMLAHSPPLPLIIDYQVDHHNVTAGDEEGIMLALQHRDRVRRISLRVRPVPSLQKTITAINDEFPILEFLSIVAPPNHNAHLILPSSFNVRSTATPHPHFDTLCFSDWISFTYNCRRPLRTITSMDPPIHIPPSKSIVTNTFTLASSGDTQNRLSLPSGFFKT